MVVVLRVAMALRFDDWVKKGDGRGWPPLQRCAPSISPKWRLWLVAVAQVMIIGCLANTIDDRRETRFSAGGPQQHYL